ncbi:hypothetical protein TNCV_1356311 [Trichonephila clavipes]|uniref:Uncharacterized protein n=1 Tax=Trichonephila clavipes TaxID=2585209 RepID=A0A8X6SBJ1_TRICX|nr:hypothetical protein TNCV_1356311 [Trichonephila clavipes]
MAQKSGETASAGPAGHYPRIHSPAAHSEGILLGDFREMKKFDQTPYKLPPPTPAHVPAEKRPLEEKSQHFFKRRSKVRITPVVNKNDLCE